MKQYDYLLVGSGLYCAVFAFMARKQGKTCLVLETRDHIGGTARRRKGSGYTATAPTFSILLTGRYGTLSTSLQSLTGIPTAR